MSSARHRTRTLLVSLLLVTGGVMAGAMTSPEAARAQSSAAAPAYLSVIDDVPLMPGLAERRDSAVVFDKPEGRIVEAEAVGRANRAEVLKFYAASLPQLGWKARGDGKFLRDGEELALSFAASGPTLTVRFTLAPDR